MYPLSGQNSHVISFKTAMYRMYLSFAFIMQTEWPREPWRYVRYHDDRGHDARNGDHRDERDGYGEPWLRIPESLDMWKSRPICTVFQRFPELVQGPFFFPEPPNVGVEPMVSWSFSLKSIPYFCARKGLFYRLKGIMTIDWRYWCWLFSNYEDTIYVWGIAPSDILKGGMDSAQVYVRRTSNNVGKALVNHSYSWFIPPMYSKIWNGLLLLSWTLLALWSVWCLCMSGSMCQGKPLHCETARAWPPRITTATGAGKVAHVVGDLFDAWQGLATNRWPLASFWADPKNCEELRFSII